MSCSKGKGLVVDFETLDNNAKTLLKSAVEVRQNAYCPYSKFAVGACLQCEDGSTYKGCNVENAVLGLTICAERGAGVSALSEGKKKFTAVAVIGEQEQFTTPCGSCRQFLSEFNLNMTVYVSKPALDKVLVCSLKELLPYAFSLH